MNYLRYNTLMKEKVFVAVSGGVDSSVSAALLKEDGYDVTGVFIKVWQPDFLECTWKEEQLDAMRVCATLDIPFLTFDFEEEYKEGVVDYMISEYKEGRVPNPDVMCNKYVKFGAFLDKAMSMGADYIATGHYAQNINNKLVKGIDQNKDQTYFLWTLTKEQIGKTFFPVGMYEKDEVRKIAEKFKLPTAKKKDSQGLCFIGKLDMRDFLKHFIEEKKGDVLDGNNKVIGVHDGATFYTVGQRHGFTVRIKSPNEGPHYIVAKNMQENTITVSTRLDEIGLVRELKLQDINWVSDVPKIGDELEARIRYRQTLFKCKFTSDDEVLLDDMQNFIASGQSMVFYKGDMCLGGGIIV